MEEDGSYDEEDSESEDDEEDDQDQEDVDNGGQMVDTAELRAARQ